MWSARPEGVVATARTANDQTPGSGVDSSSQLVVESTVAGVAVVTLERDVAENDVAAVDAALRDAFAAGGPVVLDLGDCRRMVPSFLLAVRRWSKRAALLGLRFGVCSASSAVRIRLVEFRSGSTMTLFSTLSQAVKDLNPRAKEPLGDILVREFGLSREALVKALDKQRKTGRPLGRILIEDEAVHPLDLAMALVKQDSGR